MKQIKDNTGILLGETRYVSVCSNCGCRQLFIQVSGKLYRLKKCPQCGHILKW